MTPTPLVKYWKLEFADPEHDYAIAGMKECTEKDPYAYVDALDYTTLRTSQAALRASHAELLETLKLAQNVMDKMSQELAHFFASNEEIIVRKKMTAVIAKAALKGSP